jgi:phosphatidate cytidylyltransferase
MNNFLKRTLSGALFVVVIVGSIMVNSYIFLVVFGLICGWTTFEFHKLTNQQKDIDVNIWLASCGAILLFICSYLSASSLCHFPVFSVYGTYIISVILIELFAKKNNPIHNWAYFILGQIFIALPFSLLNFIAFIDNYQPLILLALFVTIWINDSGAYIVGVTLGKHRLFERISPKKSWEGFFGGATFALLSGYLFSLLIPQICILNWVIFSEIVVIFGTFGDLTESLLKRTLNVKDSGNVIPGHGGLLDRFDSMLLAAPAIFIFLSIPFLK